MIKKLIILLLILLFGINLNSQTYLLECKNKREAEQIEKRFYKADYANDYFVHDEIYYFELDEDDIDNNWRYGILNRKVIKKRYYKRIFEFIILDTPAGYFRVES